MSELLVMRHAKSDWTTGDTDFDRPLNDRGARAAERMADWLVANDLIPDRVVSSPAERAKATAMTVVRACGIDLAQVDYYDELYLAGVAAWLEVLRRQSCERLLVCGHNPGLDDLVEHLSVTPPPLADSGKLMTTAAVAHFTFDVPWSDLGAGTAILLSLTRPREL